MRSKIVLFLTFVFLVSFSLTVSAQNSDVGILAKLAGGEVKSVDDQKIVLQTKDGLIDVILTDKTIYKRLSPENPDPKAAIDAAFADVGVGDRLIATGEVSADKKQIPANKVFIMSKADIAKKMDDKLAEWRTRGINGRVTAINLEKSEITISVKNLMGETNVVITPKENAEILRYSTQSADFNDATKSNIKEISVGDSLRSVGDKSADSLSFSAEKIISGTFQTLYGTVKSIDVAKNEVVIEDIKTKQNIIVEINKKSILKTYPEEMATKLAMMRKMSAGGAMPPRPAGGQGQGAGEGKMRSDEEIFFSLPQITAGDLKVGEMIAVSSSKTTDISRITAFRLAGGIKPFLETPQVAGGKRQGSSGQNSNFSIPGLDGGIDAP